MILIMRILRYFSLVVLLLALSLGACQKQLDIEPQDGLLNSEQIARSAEAGSDRANALVNGLYYRLKEVGESTHWYDDFGYMSLALSLESMGDYWVGMDEANNLYAASAKYQDQGPQSGVSSRAWIYCYRYIKQANLVLGTVDGGGELGGYAHGQARAMRAWAYTQLIQLFQHTYKGHEQELGVPLHLETTDPLVRSIPRATVQQVYDLILSDLNFAVEKLEGFHRSGKGMIDAAVAYGLRCRVHMLMEHWAEAAADAQKAIDLSGAIPYSLADCSIPNFDDIEAASNTIWGISVSALDEVVTGFEGGSNFTSQVCSMVLGGKSAAMESGYRRIDSVVYERIPATDVRKGWWITYDEGHPIVKPNPNTGKQDTIGFEPKSPLVQVYPRDVVETLAGQLPKLSVLKFAPYAKNPMSPIGAGDFPLMRVEEMYLNKIEAEGRGGNLAGAVADLKSFVTTYRDPSYAPTIGSEQELVDELYFQRGIEFYGEGLHFYDMVRYRKGLERGSVVGGKVKNHGYPASMCFNLPAGAQNFVVCIPFDEEQGNPAIQGHTNPVPDLPVPLQAK